jgi:hypothetical protein
MSDQPNPGGQTPDPWTDAIQRIGDGRLDRAADRESGEPVADARAAALDQVIEYVLVNHPALLDGFCATPLGEITWRGEARPVVGQALADLGMEWVGRELAVNKLLAVARGEAQRRDQEAQRRDQETQRLAAAGKEFRFLVLEHDLTPKEEAALPKDPRDAHRLIQLAERKKREAAQAAREEQARIEQQGRESQAGQAEHFRQQRQLDAINRRQIRVDDYQAGASRWYPLLSLAVPLAGAAIVFTTSRKKYGDGWAAAGGVMAWLAISAVMHVGRVAICSSPEAGWRLAQAGTEAALPAPLNKLGAGVVGEVGRQGAPPVTIINQFPPQASAPPPQAPAWTPQVHRGGQSA